MINQYSAGIILYAVQDHKILYLLLQHNKKYWNFAKGQMEVGETLEQTALRETQEETGVNPEQISLEPGFRSSYRYSFRVEHGRMIHKEVVFYLGCVASTEVRVSDEHLAYGWYDYTQAKKLLFYKNSQKLLFEAHDYLMHRKSENELKK